MPKTANIPANQTLPAHNPAHHSWKTSRNPDFSPEVGMQGPSIAEYSQKCTSPPPPHGANQNKSAAKRPRAIFIQINYCPHNSDEPQGGEQVPSRRTPQDERTPAARSAQRGFFHVRGRAGKEGRPRAGQLRQVTRRCKPSCAYPRQRRTGYRSGSREASSSRGRSRCSQPGRSRSHRHRRPCCRSRPPGR